MKRFFSLTLTLPLVCVLIFFNASGQSGAPDPDFNPDDVGYGYGDGANDDIYATCVQQDGKIIAGGDFTSFDGIATKGIVRLNPDGTVDPAFRYNSDSTISVRTIAVQNDGKIILGAVFNANASYFSYGIIRLNPDGSRDRTFYSGSGANSSINTIALQDDGKIIIGGDFTSYLGYSIGRLARLNRDGTYDQTFNTGSGVNNTLHKIAILDDGKIMIAGYFSSYKGTPVKQIARIHADGSLDTSFNPGSGYGIGLNGSVYSFSVQSDNKIIVGGNFTSYSGISRSHIARLNTDGSLDLTFEPAGTNKNYVTLTAILSNGKIVIGGNFDTVNSVFRHHVALLNPDGSLDESFEPGKGLIFPPLSLELQNDDKIILAGTFNYYNSIGRNKIIKIYQDGSVDFSFNPGTGANERVYDCLVQPDNKILIGGSFSSFNNAARNGVARLLPDGSIDNTFVPEIGPAQFVQTIALQADEKIIAGGAFRYVQNFPTASHLIRFNNDGSVDTSFKCGSGPGSAVFAIDIQSDEKIIIGGVFNSYDGIERYKIARLNPDGSLDQTFNPVSGPNHSIYTIDVQPDGKIIIGGDFTSYDGVPINKLARLNADGSLDISFNSGNSLNSTVYSVCVQPDGKIIAGGNFTYYQTASKKYIARFNPDGSFDSSFDPGSGPSQSVRTIARQSDGRIILGGLFSHFDGVSVNGIARLNSDGSLDVSFDPGSGAQDRIVYTTAFQENEDLIIGGNFTSYSGMGRNRIARIFTTDFVTPTFSPIFEQNENILQVSASPNPFDRYTVLDIESSSGITDLTLDIFDSKGMKVLHMENITPGMLKVERTILTPGLLFYQFRHKNQLVYSGKLIVSD